MILKKEVSLRNNGEMFYGEIRDREIASSVTKIYSNLTKILIIFINRIY